MVPRAGSTDGTTNHFVKFHSPLLNLGMLKREKENKDSLYLDLEVKQNQLL